MTIELIDIAVRDKAAHPRLLGRITGHVRATLLEERDGREHRHDLIIPVWANCLQDMSDADIDMALMVKAAGIITRVKTSLSRAERPAD